MSAQRTLILVSVAAALGIAGYRPAMALNMHECSAKYHAAQKAGTLNGMTWQEFRKAECGAAAEAAPSAPAPGKTAEAPRNPPVRSIKPTTAVFPTRIDPKYSKDSPGTARLRTCTDQYNANKARNANGDMKWIEKIVPQEVV